MAELPFINSSTKYIKKALVIIVQDLKKKVNTRKNSRTL